jgi:potassium/chloride transporter 9
MSRQSSGVRFSSRPVPETQITDEGGASKISFAATPALERPSFSRQSSAGRFSSRPVPETRTASDGGNQRTISFAEQPVYHPASASHSRHHSRQGSQYSNFGEGDASLNISGLLQSYRFEQQTPPQFDEGEGAGAPYSTQGLSLSFNDLPSRAQHLILNELMRRNSADTAVLMTTLPVPREGTCMDDTATIQYLSDIEVLCNELPPTLMVLSNSMTVTVNL